MIVALRWVAVAAALVAVVPGARAEPPGGGDESVSIDGLIDIAVRRSATLSRVRSQRRIARLGATVAGAADEWRVQATAGVTQRHAAAPATAAAQPAPASETTAIDLSAGVAKRLPTGADLSVALAATETAAGAVHTATAAVRQPLLRGRGSASRADRRKAAIAADTATLVARDGAASHVRVLIAAYWELAHTRGNLVVREQSLALAKTQLELTRKMHDRGTVPETAVKAARYNVALREERLLRAGDDVRAASMQLRRLAGLEITSDGGDLIATDRLVVDDHAIDVDGAIADALEHNPRLAAARLGVAIADVELDRRKNAALPALDFGVTASASGAGDDHGAAWQSLGHGAAYQIGGNVAVTWEIGGAARASAEVARIERTDARLEATEVERDVIAAVIETAGRVRAARKRTEVVRKAIDLAQANLDAELALFRADKSSNVLVFERQTELDEARLLESRAAADYQIALADLDYLTGSLLDRHGVEVNGRSAHVGSAP
jgi:outer membrane protein TolC